MCTAFAKKGNDLLFGYNLDINPKDWNFALYKTSNYFTVGIKVGSTLYFTHGVNRYGSFGNLPYMNGEPFTPQKGAKRERIDLMVDKLIRNKYSFADVKEIVNTKTVVNIPRTTMHSLFANSEGEMLIVEPGYDCRDVKENYALLTNFPIFADIEDYSNPFYGKDRYDTAKKILSSSGDDFSVADALALLCAVKQTGEWGTRISFVYSRNENKVYYCLDGDFDRVFTHAFE